MTVLDPNLNADHSVTGAKEPPRKIAPREVAPREVAPREVAHREIMPRQRDHALRVEPMMALEWSHAIEAAGGVGVADSPAQTRRAWIHRADEEQVLALFRAVGPDAPAPWWLRALSRGKIASRAAAFAVEDEVTRLLGSRPGWVFVPWATEGEVGYWEFVPSESGVYGPAEPTTVQFTDRHPGFVDLLPAHRGPGLSQAIEFTPAELREQIEDLENIA